MKRQGRLLGATGSQTSHPGALPHRSATRRNDWSGILAWRLDRRSLGEGERDTTCQSTRKRGNESRGNEPRWPGRKTCGYRGSPDERGDSHPRDQGSSQSPPSCDESLNSFSTSHQAQQGSKRDSANDPESTNAQGQSMDHSGRDAQRAKRAESSSGQERDPVPAAAPKHPRPKRAAKSAQESHLDVSENVCGALTDLPPASDPRPVWRPDRARGQARRPGRLW